MADLIEGKQDDKQEEKESEIIQQVNSFYTTYSEPLRKIKEQMNRYYMAYRGKSSKKGIKGRAKVSTQELYRAVESLVANVYAILLSEDPWFMASPDTPDRQEYAKKIEHLIESQLEKMQFKRLLLQILRKSAIEGVCFPGLFWREDKVMLPELKMPDGTIGKNVPITKYDNPELVIPSNIDLIFNPFTNVLEECLAIECVPWSKLSAMQKSGVIYGIDRLKNAANKGSSKEQDLKNERKRKTGFTTPEDVKKKGEYYLWSYWGSIPKKWLNEEPTLDEQGNPVEIDLSEEVAGNIIVCDNVLLGLRRNPYWHQEVPYFAVPWVEIDNELIGIGAGEIGEPLQNELNTTRSQLLDHKNFSLYGIWKKLRTANIKNTDLKMLPDQVIETDDMNGLDTVKPNSAAFGEGLNTEAVVKDDLRAGVGATATVQGIALSKRQTSNEVNVLAAQGGSRLRLIATTIAETFLKPFLSRLYWLDQQYITDERIIKAIGDEGIEWYKVSPQEIYGTLDFVPKVMTDMDNRQAVRGDLISMLQIAVPIAPDSPVYSLLRRIYEMYGFKDSKAVFPMSKGEHINLAASLTDYRAQLVPKAEAGDERAIALIQDIDKRLDKHLRFLGVDKSAGQVPPPEQLPPEPQQELGI